MPLTLNLQSFYRFAPTDIISRVSAGALDELGGGERAHISADGRSVVFTSLGAFPNPPSGDSRDQVIRKDLIGGSITYVATNAAGTEAANASTDARLSSDGRYVTFQSTATNLVPGVMSGTHFYRKDLVDGSIDLITAKADGTPISLTSPGRNAVFSPDGRYVLFESDVADAVAGDTNRVTDIFLKDTMDGAIVRVSTKADGTQIEFSSIGAQFHPDGLSISFETVAPLVAGDANGDVDIYRKNLLTGALTCLSTKDGIPGGGGRNAQFSADGRYVIFESAGQLVASDTDFQTDIYRKNLTDGSIVRVSTKADGSQAANAPKGNANISADGRYVVFESSAPDLVSGDGNNDLDIFRKDLTTGEIVRLSVKADGTETNFSSARNATISADGRYVVFDSSAHDLVSNDLNGKIDVFRVDTAFLPYRQAIAEGRFVEAKLGVGSASKVSMAWGGRSHRHGDAFRRQRVLPPRLRFGRRESRHRHGERGRADLDRALHGQSRGRPDGPQCRPGRYAVRRGGQ
jgi:Tol biopolymer transport system component